MSVRFLAWAARLLSAAAVVVLFLDPAYLDGKLLLEHVLRLVIYFWITAELGRIFVVGLVRSERIGGMSVNMLTSGFMIFLTLIIMESLFMFVPQSHGVGYTYGAKNWFDYYWRTNELGFRDKSIRDVDRAKPRILVVGDSFTAGHGVRCPSETFTGRLRKMAGPRYEVLNVGSNGADTREEYARLLKYPYPPDILILQYYGNDIQKAANEAGIEFPGFSPYSDLAPLLVPLVKTSYLLNFLYWQFPHADGKAYLDFLEEAYKDPLAMNKHIADLEFFVTYAKERKVPLLVVIFPLLRDLQSSAIFTRPVGQFFSQNNIPIISVADLVTDMPVAQRVVNHHDGHPSPELHAKVADAIWTALESLSWTRSAN